MSCTNLNLVKSQNLGSVGTVSNKETLFCMGRENSRKL